MGEKRKKGGRCERKRRKEKRHREIDVKRVNKFKKRKCIYREGKKVFQRGGGYMIFLDRYMPLDTYTYLNREAECRDHRLSQTN
jgi:hypothetical protein